MIICQGSYRWSSICLHWFLQVAGGLGDWRGKAHDGRRMGSCRWLWGKGCILHLLMGWRRLRRRGCCRVGDPVEELPMSKFFINKRSGWTPSCRRISRPSHRRKRKRWTLWLRMWGARTASQTAHKSLRSGVISKITISKTERAKKTNLIPISCWKFTPPRQIKD